MDPQRWGCPQTEFLNKEAQNCKMFRYMSEQRFLAPDPPPPLEFRQNPIFSLFGDLAIFRNFCIKNVIFSKMVNFVQKGKILRFV